MDLPMLKVLLVIVIKKTKQVLYISQAYISKKPILIQNFLKERNEKLLEKKKLIKNSFEIKSNFHKINSKYYTNKSIKPKRKYNKNILMGKNKINNFTEIFNTTKYFRNISENNTLVNKNIFIRKFSTNIYAEDSLVLKNKTKDRLNIQHKSNFLKLKNNNLSFNLKGSKKNMYKGNSNYFNTRTDSWKFKKVKQIKINSAEVLQKITLLNLRKEKSEKIKLQRAVVTLKIKLLRDTLKFIVKKNRRNRLLKKNKFLFKLSKTVRKKRKLKKKKLFKFLKKKLFNILEIVKKSSASKNLVKKKKLRSVNKITKKVSFLNTKIDNLNKKFLRNKSKRNINKILFNRFFGKDNLPKKIDRTGTLKREYKFDTFWADFPLGEFRGVKRYLYLRKLKKQKKLKNVIFKKLLKFNYKKILKINNSRRNQLLKNNTEKELLKEYLKVRYEKLKDKIFLSHPTKVLFQKRISKLVKPIRTYFSSRTFKKKKIEKFPSWGYPLTVAKLKKKAFVKVGKKKAKIIFLLENNKLKKYRYKYKFLSGSKMPKFLQDKNFPIRRFANKKNTKMLQKWNQASWEKLFYKDKNKSLPHNKRVELEQEYKKKNNPMYNILKIFEESLPAIENMKLKRGNNINNQEEISSEKNVSIKENQENKTRRIKIIKTAYMFSEVWKNKDIEKKN